MENRAQLSTTGVYKGNAQKKLKENIKTNKNMTNESSRNLKKSWKSMVDKVVEDEVRHNKGLKIGDFI